MHQCPCHCQPQDPTPPRRRGGFIRSILSMIMLYGMLVFGGGTLINTGHPVASEVGKIMHLVTFVEPAIYWTEGHDMQTVSHGLRVLSSGVHI